MLSIEQKKQLKEILKSSVFASDALERVLKKSPSAKVRIFFEEFYREAMRARLDEEDFHGEREMRRELLRVLRRLQASGLGKLVVGRKGARTRFHWWVDIADVLALISVDEQPLRAAEPPAPEYGSAPKTITHRFALRPGLPIQFDLPADLTANEAIRLAAFVRALPFELLPPRSLEKLLALSGKIDLGASDISENVHKYAAEAYEDKD